MKGEFGHREHGSPKLLAQSQVQIDLLDDNGNLTTADVTFNYVTLSALANWYF